MFFLLSADDAAKAAEHAPQAQEQAVHHAPILVKLVNHYFGEWAHHLEMKYTYPIWKKVLGKFGTTPEAAFGAYTPENAIPWYTIMFIVACILTVTLIWILKGKLSEDEPGAGQQTLEVGVLAVRSMLQDIVGPHGLQYFPVVMTFALLILISNLMGFFPLFMSPTAATSVTFALGLTSFLYYNYIGIKENGVFGHLKHLAGPIWWIAPLIFSIELISNLIRPFTLGIRLFANIFSDEKVMETFTHLFPPYSNFVLPNILILVLLLPLSLFVAFIQTFVFVLLSQLYISEVSHPHEEHGEHDHDHAGDAPEILAPALT
jgi:F-type H+-transporting ATPase subunit a